MARKFDKQTEFGGYLDIVLDFLVYGIVPVGLVVADPTTTNYLALSLMLGKVDTAATDFTCWDCSRCSDVLCERRRPVHAGRHA